MQEAFGGILNLVLIALFLVIVEGILAFTVSYTKAFKMKNIVISAIEEYEGSHCIPESSSDNPNSACRQKIREGAERIGYSPTTRISCPNKSDGYVGDWYVVDDRFCAKESISQSGDHIYRIVTQVDINIPIINRIMGLSFFQVSGDTRVVKKSK